MNKKKYIKAGIFLVVSAAIAFGIYMFMTRPEEVEYANPVKEDYIQTVLASGYVRADEYVSVVPEVSARINSLSVIEGDYVIKGQQIAKLDSSDVGKSVNDAKAAVNSANASYQAIVGTSYAVALKDIQTLELEIAQLKDDYARNLALYESGALPKIEVEKIENTLKIKQSALESSRLKAASFEQNGTEAKKAAAAVNQARVSLANANKDYGKYTVNSPADGLVTNLYASEGEQTQAGQSMAEIAKSNLKMVKIQVDEKNITKIFIGQKAFIYPSSDSDLRVESKVSGIAEVVDSETGTVDVSIEIPQDQYEKFLIDLSVTAELVINEFPSSLVLDSNYIINEEDKSYILTEQQGMAVKRQIDVKGSGSRLVVSGDIDEKTAVLSPSEIEEGKKVDLIQKEVD